jgi:hypothetical protein
MREREKEVKKIHRDHSSISMLLFFIGYEYKLIVNLVYFNEIIFLNF